MASSFGGSSQFSRGVRNDTSIKAWFDHNVRDITYGVLYAMVKENNFNRIFVILSIVVEFFQMIFFCFVTDFKWGGISIDLQVSSLFGSYGNFKILFWIVIAFLCLVVLNVGYIGYTLYQGEIKSIILLRSLRWICSLIVTILFVPILYVLLGPLVCSYSTSPPSLHTYPLVQCWGSENLALAIISIVLLVIFSIFALLVGLTYYEYDPNMIKTYSRLQNRFEFGTLIIKIIIVFVSEFLHDEQTIYAVFSLVTSFLLVVGAIIMVPAYDHKMNLMRAGSYAGVFWVNICMMLALGLNDRDNLASTIAAGVGCPFFIGLGVFVADRRIKYLCNPKLVDGLLSGTSEIKLGNMKPAKKGVKWDQPKYNKTLRNALYPRLKFPIDVEIAARFVLQEKPNAALIEKAKTVYHTGLSKFPKSPTVIMAYTNFIFSITGDWQLGYSSLEKLRKTHPFLDIAFFIYRYDKDREHRIEGGSNKIGDYVDFMEYKKLMRAAKQYHHMALVCIRKFWRYLLDSKIDVMQLSNLSSKIAFAEKKATENYTRLLTRYPKNIRVLRDYARFLDEVVTDEKLAYKYWKKADKYEEREMEKLTESHRSANNTESTPYDNTSESEDNHSEEKSSHNSDLSSQDGKTISTTSSGVNSGLEIAKSDKNSNLKKLGWIMFFTTLFAMVVMCTQLAVLHRQLGRFNDVVSCLDGAGGASHTGIRVANQALDFYKYLNLINEGTFTTQSTFEFMPPEWNLAYYAYSLEFNFNLMINNIKSLYWGESHSLSFTTYRRQMLRRLAGMHLAFDPSLPMDYDQFDHKTYNKKEVQHFFSESSWNQSMLVGTGDDAARIYFNIDLWSLAFLTSSNGFQISSITSENYHPGDKIFEFLYVVDNAPELARGVRNLMDLYSEMITKEVNTLTIVIIVMFVGAVVLLVLASAVFFMPVVNSIFEYKIKTFYIFTIIPSSVVKHMVKRKINNLGNDTSDVDDEEDDYNNNVAKIGKVTTSNKFGGWKGDEIKSNEDSEDEEEIKAKKKTKQLTPRFGEALPELPGTPSGDDLQETRTLGESSTIAKPTQISVEISNPEQITADGAEETDAPKPSYLQQIKNKIMLKLPVNKFTKLSQSDDESDKEHERVRARKHSRMNTTSMKQVTRRLHLSYLIAMACFVIALLISFLTLTSEFKTLNGLSNNLKNSDIRTQYAHLLLFDIEVLVTYPPTDDFVATTLVNLNDHIEKLWATHKAINAPDYQMDLLFGTACFRINQTLCPHSSADYQYYDLIDKGVEYTFMQFITIGVNLQKQYLTDGYLNYTDPSYTKFRALAENDLMDGLERLTFTFQQHAAKQLSSAKLRVGIITGVVCVAFAAIHIAIFKPFVNRLRAESEHTFSIIRMIPRKMLTDVAEIQEFIQESIESSKEY